MTKFYSALSNTRLHSAELMSNILHVQHFELQQPSRVESANEFANRMKLATRPRSRLGGSSNFWLVSEEVPLSPVGFQSHLGSSCSAVRATIGSGAEASRKYKYNGSRN
jgi:hypothetical protein